MDLRFRQGLVKFQINTGGTSTFLRVSGNSGNFIDLICDESPVIFTIAHGVANYLIQENSTVTQAWGPLVSHGETQYLYWDISLLDASLTRGFTTLFPFVGAVAPDNPAYDQHWFDSVNHIMNVWNGSKWIQKLRVFAGIYTDNAILIPHQIGSQVSDNSINSSGSILLGKNGFPLRNTDGTFVTAESDLISAFSSGESIKFEALQLYGQALEFIPKFSAITFDKPGKIKLASNLFPNQVINGIVTSDLFTGEISKIVNSGLVRNEQWTFFDNQVNHPLYVGANGEITLVPPQSQTRTVLGYVYDNSAIIVNIQKLGEVTQIATSAFIDLIGDISGSGNAVNPIYTTLSNTGVTSGTYNSVTVDGKGRVTAGSSVPYLTGNQNITYIGDVTGSGTTSVQLTLTDTGIAPGTYNNVTVDSKGRVVNAIYIPTQSINPLLVNNGLISNWYTKVLSFDTNFDISTTGLGEQLNPGDVSLTLSDTGVIPGIYNNVTVDSKGRVVNGNNISINVTGDVIGSGISNLDLTLIDSGVIAGEYTKVVVDSKGRVISGSQHIVDTSLILTGDITGIGTGTLITTLSNTGVIPGTYNNVTVDSKGRITNASNVIIDTSVTLTGDVIGSGTGTFATTLSNTGVIPGTYNSFTVDSKGRIINAFIVDTSFATTLTGDVIGSGTGTFATTLSNTGVIPGTYNSFTVNSQGRITNAWVQTTVGVQYLNDLLDVTITSPLNHQSLLFNGTEWVNNYLDRIVNGTNNIIIDSTSIKHNIGDINVIMSNNTNTNIGVNLNIVNWEVAFSPFFSTAAGSYTTVIQDYVTDYNSNCYVLLQHYTEGPSLYSLLKINSAGDILWRRLITPPNTGSIYFIKLLMNNHINKVGVLLQWSIATPTFGANYLTFNIDSGVLEGDAVLPANNQGSNPSGLDDIHYVDAIFDKFNSLVLVYNVIPPTGNSYGVIIKHDYNNGFIDYVNTGTLLYTYSANNILFSKIADDFDGNVTIIGMDNASSLPVIIQIPGNFSTTNWSITHNSDVSHFSNIVTDSQGNIYCIGTTFNTGAPIISKFDALGTLLLCKMITTSVGYSLVDFQIDLTTDHLYCVFGSLFLQIDSNLNLINERQFDGNNIGWPKIVLNPFENIVFFGNLNLIKYTKDGSFVGPTYQGGKNIVTSNLATIDNFYTYSNTPLISTSILYPNTSYNGIGYSGIGGLINEYDRLLMQFTNPNNYIVEIKGDIKFNNDFGTLGHVFSSNGPDRAPSWRPVTIPVDDTTIKFSKYGLTIRNDDLQRSQFYNNGGGASYVTFNSVGLITDARSLIVSDLPTLSLSNLSDITLSTPLVGNILSFDGTKWVNSVPVTGVSALVSLTDVTLTNPVSGNILSFNGTTWVNDMPSANTLTNATDVAITNPVAGDVLMYDGSKWVNGRSLTTSYDLTFGIDSISAANSVLSGYLATRDLTINNTTIAGSKFYVVTAPLTNITFDLYSSDLAGTKVLFATISFLAGSNNGTFTLANPNAPFILLQNHLLTVETNGNVDFNMKSIFISIVTQSALIW